ncbi:nuclear transport factor 2 family protein [Amycolatopsis rhabdoformis]|uniref:Nuclear transport factor 2 family protein n=1 Tax=Amycolatopsis rhabdoformis TaxID=1448059 RepID=A0ABZ1IDJ0_9PSEU|nr:nuclear transport factor 2 family protein [Amycolatopsis rhabdoformis]WSE32332.1 nuclear transport factor 2 family protein [Amycolatopsis rhabdoformis]
MTSTDHGAILSARIAATNTHDTDAYLGFFTDDAVLDDPSVGEKFVGKEGIADYYRSYFIGYNTTTRLVSVEPEDDHLHVVVEFTGDFPGGRTGGIFDVTLNGDKISFVHANLA